MSNAAFRRRTAQMNPGGGRRIGGDERSESEGMGSVAWDQVKAEFQPERSLSDADVEHEYFANMRNDVVFALGMNLDQDLRANDDDVVGHGQRRLVSRYIKEAAKKVVNHEMKKKMEAIRQEFNSCFKQWLLGKHVTLNNPLIGCPRGWTSYQQQFPRAINWALYQLEMVRVVRTFLHGLYLRGPRSEEEAEWEFRYLVWPLEKAMKRLKAFRVSDLEHAADDFEVRPEDLCASIDGTYDWKERRINTETGTAKWPRDMTYFGRVPKKNDVPLCLHPAVNPFMRAKWVSGVTYQQWMAGDFSGIMHEEQRALWEIAADRVYGRDERFLNPFENPESGTAEQRALHDAMLKVSESLGDAEIDAQIVVAAENAPKRKRHYLCGEVPQWIKDKNGPDAHKMLNHFVPVARDEFGSEVGRALDARQGGGGGGQQPAPAPAPAPAPQPPAPAPRQQPAPAPAPARALPQQGGGGAQSDGGEDGSETAGPATRRSDAARLRKAADDVSEREAEDKKRAEAAAREYFATRPPSQPDQQAAAVDVAARSVAGYQTAEQMRRASHRLTQESNDFLEGAKFFKRLADEETSPKEKARLLDQAAHYASMAQKAAADAMRHDEHADEASAEAGREPGPSLALLDPPSSKADAAPQGGGNSNNLQEADKGTASQKRAEKKRQQKVAKKQQQQEKFDEQHRQLWAAAVAAKGGDFGAKSNSPPPEEDGGDEAAAAAEEGGGGATEQPAAAAPQPAPSAWSRAKSWFAGGSTYTEQAANAPGTRPTEQDAKYMAAEVALADLKDATESEAARAIEMVANATSNLTPADRAKQVKNPKTKARNQSEAAALSQAAALAASAIAQHPKNKALVADAKDIIEHARDQRRSMRLQGLPPEDSSIDAVKQRLATTQAAIDEREKLRQQQEAEAQARAAAAAGDAKSQGGDSLADIPIDGGVDEEDDAENSNDSAATLVTAPSDDESDTAGDVGRRTPPPPPSSEASLSSTRSSDLKGPADSADSETVSAGAKSATTKATAARRSARVSENTASAAAEASESASVSESVLRSISGDKPIEDKEKWEAWIGGIVDSDKQKGLKLSIPYYELLGVSVYGGLLRRNLSINPPGKNQLEKWKTNYDAFLKRFESSSDETRAQFETFMDKLKKKRSEL